MCPKLNKEMAEKRRSRTFTFATQEDVIVYDEFERIYNIMNHGPKNAMVLAMKLYNEKMSPVTTIMGDKTLMEDVARKFMGDREYRAFVKKKERETEYEMDRLLEEEERQRENELEQQP